MTHFLPYASERAHREYRPSVRPSVRDAQNARYAADTLISKVKGEREGEREGGDQGSADNQWNGNGINVSPITGAHGRGGGRTALGTSTGATDRASEWESTSSSFLAIRAVRLRPKLHS